MHKPRSFIPTIIGFVILIGLFLRLYHISDNQFLFYDEALYIGYNRTLLNLIANNPAHNLGESVIILSLIFKTALSMPKPLWFFLLSLRVFILGPQAWFFARWISAAAGLMTVVILFFWTRYHFKSTRIGILSALILLILPSHIFYSRLGMQEALSALLFLSAIYFYTLKERLGWNVFVSAFLLSCVYFTNYRMIISPIFIVFIEALKAFSEKKKFDWLKLFVYGGVFLGFVILVGMLYGGINFQITFAWMFHQAQDASGKFNPINFISFPFYVFALEGFFFAILFWSNLALIKYKEFSKLLPFGLVLLQMGIFSFAAEKGARYLCVVLPMMAAAVAVVIDDGWQRFPKMRSWIMTIGCLGVAGMIWLSTTLSLARTDYENAVHFITDRDPDAVIVSTQPLVEGLFMTNEKKMVPCPNDLYSLARFYQQGARYLILDPQAYISWTADGRRFSPPLVDFLENTVQTIQPIGEFPHLDHNILLTRLVMDHNEQILDSLLFLSHADAQGYGKIRIYDLRTVFSAIIKN